MKPWILVIGGSHDQSPMIGHARSLGCQVLVADGSSVAPGLDLADDALVVDTSDHAALIAAAGARAINGVCTMATNLGPRSVAAVATALGLPAISPSAALAATDKHLMKEACRVAGLAVAAGGTCTLATQATRIADQVGYPVLLKAADASGCRGIEPASSQAELLKVFPLSQKESRNGKVVVERYYPAARVIGVESLIDRGHTHTIFSAEKLVRRFPRISTAGVILPAPLAPDEWARIEEKITALHSALGLDFGASHIDFVEADGDWLVIDVGPRLAGGPMIHHLAPRLTGVDMVDFVVRQALGETPIVRLDSNPGVGVERFLYTTHPGRLVRCVMPESCPSHLRLEWRKPVGSILHADGPNVERLGCISLIAPDIFAAEREARALAASIQLELELADGRLIKVSPEVLNGEVHLCIQ